MEKLRAKNGRREMVDDLDIPQLILVRSTFCVHVQCNLTCTHWTLQITTEVLSLFTIRILWLVKLITYQTKLLLTVFLWMPTRCSYRRPTCVAFVWPIMNNRPQTGNMHNVSQRCQRRIEPRPMAYQTPPRSGHFGAAPWWASLSIRHGDKSNWVTIEAPIRGHYTQTWRDP